MSQKSQIIIRQDLGSDWLEGFAYHTTIDMFIFIGTMALMISIAGFTVGYRTYKAAVSNPIEALRDE